LSAHIIFTTLVLKLAGGPPALLRLLRLLTSVATHAELHFVP
jgi:hypothetical protein